MDIVVTIPRTVSDYHVERKFMYFGGTFWTLARVPKKLKVGDHVWFVRNGKVVHALKVRRIIANPKSAVRGAVGHNPPGAGCRIWFDSPTVGVGSEDPYEILDSEGNYRISVRGFQGFRYRWWPLQDEEKEEDVSSGEETKV